MKERIIIGVIIVVAVVVLGLPMVLNKVGDTAAPPQSAPQRSTAPTVAPPPPPVNEAPVVWQGTYERPAAPVFQSSQQAASNQPDFTEATLVGTAWEVSTPYGPVQIELGANGQATANHSMVGAVGATWRVNGKKVNATASVMGHSINIDATIKGNTLTVPGQGIRRIR